MAKRPTDSNQNTDSDGSLKLSGSRTTLIGEVDGTPVDIEWSQIGYLQEGGHRRTQTLAANTPGGCLVRVVTFVGFNQAGESMTFVPGVKVGSV